MMLIIKCLTDGDAAAMTLSNHPAVLRFPAQAGQITELMGRDEEFAGICSDYAEIAGNIAEKERTPRHSSVLLADLLQLRADLERDMFDKLGEVHK